MNDLLARLIAAGTPADLVAEVAMEIARAEAASLHAAPEKVRSAGAIRTARYRERKASQVTSQASHSSQAASQNVTCDACDVADVTQPSLPLAPSPNENISNPHPHTPTRPVNISARESSDFHVAAWAEFQSEKAAAGKPKRGKTFVAIDRPDDVSEQVWGDFLIARQRKGADITATAMKGFRREADRVGWSLEQAISESIERNWRGFKADWVKNDDRNRTGNTPAAPRNGWDRRDGFSRALDDDLERARSERAA